jgi:hypothetical protein
MNSIKTLSIEDTKEVLPIKSNSNKNIFNERKCKLPVEILLKIIGYLKPSIDIFKYYSSNYMRLNKYLDNNSNFNVFNLYKNNQVYYPKSNWEDLNNINSILHYDSCWMIVDDLIPIEYISESGSENINYIIKSKPLNYHLKNINSKYDDSDDHLDKFYNKQLFSYLEHLFEEIVDFAHKYSKVFFNKDIERDIIKSDYIENRCFTKDTLLLEFETIDFFFNNSLIKNINKGIVNINNDYDITNHLFTGIPVRFLFSINITLQEDGIDINEDEEIIWRKDQNNKLVIDSKIFQIQFCNKELNIIDNNNIVNSENSYDELLKLSHLFKKRI